MSATTDFAEEMSQQLATALMGPYFAGWISHLILAGLVWSSLSSYLESERFRRSPLAERLLLLAVFATDLISVALTMEEVFHYGTDQHRGRHDFMSRDIDMINFLLIGISASLMGSFLCRRAAGLFNSNYMHQMVYTVIFHVAIAVAFICQTTAVILACLGVSYKGFTANNLAGAFLIISAVVDVSQTVALYLLLRKRFDGNLSSIRRVLTTSAQTAALTSILTVLGAITAVAWPQSNALTSNINCAFVLPLTSLYALSLVVTLASRKPRVSLVVGSTLAGIATADFRDVLDVRRHPLKSDATSDFDAESGVGFSVGEELGRRSSSSEEEEERDEVNAEVKGEKDNSLRDVSPVRGPSRRVSFAE